MPKIKAQQFEGLQASMSKAIADGDVKAIEEIASQIVKGKADRHKVEVEKLQKEAGAMAGDRMALSVELLEAINAMRRGKDMQKLKVTGFIYKLPHEGSDVPTLGLSIPTIKAAKAGTGGNQKTKEEFGMSLDQVFEANRDLMTAEQVAEYDGATNSRKWQIKTAVKKVALTQNRIAPVK